MTTAQLPLFSKDHTWAMRTEDGGWWVGVTDYAQDMLGDVVFVDPPKVGQSVTQFEICGLIESVKTGSDVYAPLSGVVSEINDGVLASPEKINDAPYQSWIFKLAPSATGAQALLSAEAYQDVLAGL